MELHLLPQLSKYGNKQLHVTVPEGPVQISSPRTMCKASTVQFGRLMRLHTQYIMLGVLAMTNFPVITDYISSLKLQGKLTVNKTP